MANRSWSRRDVLKAGVAALAVPTFVTARALGRDGHAPASERIRVGLIGCGPRARDVVSTAFRIPTLEVVALCDILAPRMAEFSEKVDKEKKHDWEKHSYLDLREMIEKEKLDAVLVETTTHARVWCAMRAIAMGVDAYIEKPMALTIAEGRVLADWARKHNCVTQIGTQQRSMPRNNWASDLVQSGKLGTLQEVLVPNFIGPSHWDESRPAQGEPPTGEKFWDLWTNQAKMRPYHPALQYGWNKYWAYDGGGQTFGVTGWGTHSIDQAQRGMGSSETGPVELVLEESLQEKPGGTLTEAAPKSKHDTGERWRGMLAKSFGPRAKVTMTYANGVPLKWHLDATEGPGLGAIFVCENGTVEICRDDVLITQPNASTAKDSEQLAKEFGDPGRQKEAETEPHLENFAACIKSRARCTADVEYAQRTTTVCYLTNILRDAAKVGQVVHWDPATEKFTDFPEGNKLLDRERRKGFELPS